LEYKLLGVGIPSGYSEHLLMVKSSRLKKELVKNGIGIDQYDVELSGNGIDPMSA